ncbi:MAG: lysine--tRNA ligase [Candidatus Marinimicrobia bacterium]|nr:lysine--tRNA ligase [Candidatus Neomarinimicrobiota bacterium]MBT6870706.1 lysine--tRNA ligase [Candidatus Neomarinimicrobiota bacterium]
MSSENNSLNQVIKHRLEKLNKIKDAGINPFPYSYTSTHKIVNILAEQENLLNSHVSISGRIVSFRKMGKASFIHIQEESSKLQVYAKSDILPDTIYDNIVRNLDLGDIVGISGDLFITKMGELTVKTTGLELLSKNIRPLPNLKEKDGEAFNAFEDKELRYRHRHLDLIANPEVMDVFKLRAKIISTIRSELDAQDYIEVETPVLQNIYGGASARPFTTFHNTLEQKLYLRIADELYLKRLIIGGFTKVYEIAKNFRNEGMDRNHNPEFTALEFYQAYADVYVMMDLTEAIIHNVAKEISKKEVEFSGHKIDISQTFIRKSMFSLLNEATDEAVDKMDSQALFALAKTKNISVEKNMNYGQLLDCIFGALIEPKLVQPTFVTDYPKAISPLAKVSRDGNPEIVERFELFIGGMEFANSFTELNDPIEQRNRLEAQSRLRDLGDDEAQVIDEEFLMAMETGMPPTGGVGIGVDRLVMLLTEQDSIKDVLLFPAMRPE